METPKPRANIKSFSCPGCAASVPIRAVGHSVSAVCASCGRVIDISDENYRILSEAHQKISAVQPYIPLGQRGKLCGETWEVIGFMQRSDGDEEYFWREYLLFNPRRGFRWLTEADGHWSFVAMTPQAPTLKFFNFSALYSGKKFRLYYKGEAKVQFVLGEFYWRVKVGDKVGVRDYICPPAILSLEEDGSEAVWSVGEYIEAEEIQKAFQVASPPPRQEGVAPNQPNPRLKAKTGKLWLLFLFLFVLIQVSTDFLNRSQKIFESDFIWNPQAAVSPLISPSFKIEGRSSHLKIRMDVQTPQLYDLVPPPATASTEEILKFEQTKRDFASAASQNPNEMALLLESQLIHEETGKAQAIQLGAEPNASAENSLYSLPGGTYHLEMKATGTENKFWQQPYKIFLSKGIHSWSNFWLALSLLTIFPIISFFRRTAFESRRWQNSNTVGSLE